MANELSWDPVTVDMNQQYEILGSGIDDEDRGFVPVDQIIAENVTEEVKLDFEPNLQYDIFNQLKTGEWEGFNLMPSFKDLLNHPMEKSLNLEQNLVVFKEIFYHKQELLELLWVALNWELKLLQNYLFLL